MSKYNKSMKCELVVMSRGQKFLTGIGSGQFFNTQVIHLWVWKILPKIPIFLSLGQIKSHWVGPKIPWVKDR